MDKDCISQYFGKYGAIEDISIPKANNYKKKVKKSVFIQFSSVDVADKVIEQCSNKKFMGKFCYVY